MPKGGKRVPVELRLWGRVDQSGGPDACWLWPGANNKANHPYGFIGVGGSGNQGYVHRVAYELSFGPIPEGYEVDHLCKTRGVAGFPLGRRWLVRSHRGPDAGVDHAT